MQSPVISFVRSECETTFYFENIFRIFWTPDLVPLWPFWPFVSVGKVKESKNLHHAPSIDIRRHSSATVKIWKRSQSAARCRVASWLWSLWADRIHSPIWVARVARELKKKGDFSAQTRVQEELCCFLCFLFLSLSLSLLHSFPTWAFLEMSFFACLVPSIHKQINTPSAEVHVMAAVDTESLRVPVLVRLLGSHLLHQTFASFFFQFFLGKQMRGARNEER